MKLYDINNKIKELNKLKKMLMIPISADDSVEEKIFKKYLELESVSKVAEYINGIGYRIENNRKYIANDISSVIRDKNVVLNKNEIKTIVIKLFNGHKKGIKRSSW